ncbi:colanic acid/amylovoran biosynthesis glycosyltransferase [Paenibacillaceae bacterium GAS479]|nr:colanic acid/amylovoran biosynthesis glycosyltransferase [Paenibacillaceae bacterium GAS479]
MKIAFIVGEFPAISETFIINQITGLIDRGNNVKIFAYKKRNESKVHPDVKKYDLEKYCHYHNMSENKLRRLLKAGLKIIKNPSLIKTLNFFKYGTSIFNLQALYTADLFAKRNEVNFDVVYCHFGTLGNIGAIVKDTGFVQGKLITTFHGNDITAYLKRRGNNAYDFLFNTGDLFLPISDNWKNKLLELGCNQSKILVHRMGIDTSKFTFELRNLQDNETVKCTTIARLVEKKGIEFGIRAIASLVRDFPSIHYNIIGDGPLKNELSNLINDLGVSDHVHLLGWREQDEVIKILKDTHIFLAPSVTAQDGDQEGIPVVLMEALSMGIPVISTIHSGIPELILDNEFGYLVPEKDVQALAERILYLCLNSHKWSVMGIKGRDFVENHYDINRLNEKLVLLFKGPGASERMLDV